MSSCLRILPADTEALLRETSLLFREYERFLGVDLCFQDFEAELAGLPGKYAPPGGALLLAVEGHRTAGCVAVRALAENVCEMKRLFVRPAYRGSGLGRKLAEAVMREAGRLGYGIMRLDTLETLTAAMGLYESLGFRRTSAYYPNPLQQVVYLEKPLEENRA